MNKKLRNAIIASCDAKYGDFLINHWLKSLMENVDLTNTDVIILDYGMTSEQLKKLKRRVAVFKGKRDGHVTTIRFRDICTILSRKKYDQVLSTDAGDIIFQKDLKEVFENDKNSFRAVTEMMSLPFKELYLKAFFTENDANDIRRTLKGKRIVNAGVIFGPAEKFKKLSREVYDKVIKKDQFGPDQLAVNYILYRDGFKPIDEKYNFVVMVSKHKFVIKDGVFYFKDGEKISIVHNAGYHKFFRNIENFGYGVQYNKIKKIGFFLRRISITILDKLFNKSTF